MYDPNMPTTFDYRDDERQPTASVAATERSALKTCPFCNSAPDVFEDGEIQCSNKKCPVRPSARWGGAEVWNTRAATPPDTPVVAREVAYEIIGLQNPDVDRVEAIITKHFATTTSPPSETAVGGESLQELAEEIAAPTIGKVKTAVYHEIVSDIKTAIGNAYEDAAIIAENCAQDNAARDEPFRIAQTIRERAGLGARPTICIHCHGPITEGVLAGTWVHTKSGLTTCRKPGAAKADGIFNAEPAPVPDVVDDEERTSAREVWGAMAGRCYHSRLMPNCVSCLLGHASRMEHQVRELDAALRSGKEA